MMIDFFAVYVNIYCKDIKACYTSVVYIYGLDC